jgi:DNA (cytosine-5)-methyltransferase 1
MWGHMARIVGEVRPRYVFVENSPALLTRGLGRVLGDLAALGYDCRWTVLGAADVGAPHQRDRFWLVGRNMAHAEMPHDAPRASSGRCGKGAQEQFRRSCGSACDVADPDSLRQLQPQGSQCDKRGWVGDGGAEVRDTDLSRLAEWQGQPSHDGTQLAPIERADWWQSEPALDRVADGVAARVDRLKAIGNGQVPEVARTAWEELN